MFYLLQDGCTHVFAVLCRHMVAARRRVLHALKPERLLQEKIIKKKEKLFNDVKACLKAQHCPRF